MRRHLQHEISELLEQPIGWWLRRCTEVLADVISVAICVILSCAIADLTEWTFLAILFGVAALAPLIAFGTYRSASRYFGIPDFFRLLPASFTVFGLAACATVGVQRTPWTWPILASLLSLAGLSSIRIARRIFAESRSVHSKERDPSRTLVVGAGDAGEAVIRELLRRKHLHHVVGLIDDDPNKALLSIHGVPVLGRSDCIPEIATRYNIDEVLIAAPSASGDQIRRILEFSESAHLRVRTLPGVCSILAGNEVLSSLREVDIDDLLRREVSQEDDTTTRSLVEGECVMITGAGGSIGSELARQISRLNPSNLILLGKGENSIFEIDEELRWETSNPPISIIADVRDRLAMEQIFERHRPGVVFHAAAHKHVPLMQSNIREAIANNVKGTRVVAETAAKYGAKKVICVSTDKAVKPTSIMGATKRVAEMIVSAVAKRCETEMAIVRFGNVLGSRGSLIPILKRQIARGGPVKLTHPEMSRYFMTIPEAVHLVLQAAAFGRRGELFLLDMGDPIKIVDLAKDLIRLHGLVPGQDIAIEFTGIRPGEKLHEELLYADEELCCTTHPKIKMIDTGHIVANDWIFEQVYRLESLCEQDEGDVARELLMELAWTSSSMYYSPVQEQLAS